MFWQNHFSWLSTIFVFHRLCDSVFTQFGIFQAFQFGYQIAGITIIWPYNRDCYRVKGCCLNIVGDFLKIAKNGFKEYTFDYTRKKFEQLQRDALISTIIYNFSGIPNSLFLFFLCYFKKHRNKTTDLKVSQAA